VTVKSDFITILKRCFVFLLYLKLFSSSKISIVITQLLFFFEVFASNELLLYLSGVSNQLSLEEYLWFIKIIAYHTTLFLSFLCIVSFFRESFVIIIGWILSRRLMLLKLILDIEAICLRETFNYRFDIVRWKDVDPHIAWLFLS
jgi:hypothetical protein